MRTWALPLALLVVGCGPEQEQVEAPDDRYAKAPQALCVPISSSLAYDASTQRTAFRDTMVDRLVSAVRRGTEVTDEFDWIGEVTEHRFDEPGSAENYSVQVSWQFFHAANKKLPLAMKFTHPASPERDTTDRYFHDQSGRIYRFEHDVAASDADDRIEVFTHDEHGYLVGIDIERRAAVMSKSYALSYDRLGHITRWEEVFTGVWEEFGYDEYGLLSTWARRYQDEVQEHAIVAWTDDNRPILVEAHGMLGWPKVQACP